MSATTLTPTPQPPSVSLTYAGTTPRMRGDDPSRPVINDWEFSSIAFGQLWLRHIPLDVCAQKVSEALEQKLEDMPYMVHSSSENLRNCFVDIEGRACVALVNPSTKVIVTIVPQVAPREEYAQRLVEVRERQFNPYYSLTSQQLRKSLINACSSHLGFSVASRGDGTYVSHPAMESSIAIPRDINPDQCRELVHEIEDLTGITLSIR